MSSKKGNKDLAKVDRDFIKIPIDFRSVHDLSELVGNYELVSNLLKVLHNYQRTYIDSHFMDIEEVIKYIPEKDLPYYKCSVASADSSSEYTNNSTDNSYIIKDGNKPKILKIAKKYRKISKNDAEWFRLYHVLELLPKIKRTEESEADIEYFTGLINENFSGVLKGIENSKKRIFLVDTINKIIHPCQWAIEGIPIGYDIDPKKHILEVSVMTSFNDRYAVGGAWINGRANGYLSGHTSHDYTRTRELKYHFCTRTNRFLGKMESIISRAREWQDTSGRTW